MASRARSIIGGLMVLCLVGAVIVWRTMWRPENVRGDVVVRDTGELWSYPRYTIEFPTIDASVDGHHSFEVAGLPQFPLTLRLVVNGPSPEIGTLIVRIRGSDGRIVSEASDSAPKRIWHRGSTSDLWHPSLRDLSFSRDEKYTLEIDTHNVGGSTPARELVPQLKGGGNELP